LGQIKQEGISSARLGGFCRSSCLPKLVLQLRNRSADALKEIVDLVGVVSLAAYRESNVSKKVGSSGSGFHGGDGIGRTAPGC
jgi:hypothetical protein